MSINFLYLMIFLQGASLIVIVSLLADRLREKTDKVEEVEIDGVTMERLKKTDPMEEIL